MFISRYPRLSAIFLAVATAAATMWPTAAQAQPVTSSGSLSPLIVADHAHGESAKGAEATTASCTVVASYTLSREQTKALASNMRAITGPISITIASLIGLKFPVVGLVIALSANAQFESTVVYAASVDKRVHVTEQCCDAHTSYSHSRSYYIVWW